MIVGNQLNVYASPDNDDAQSELVQSVPISEDIATSSFADAEAFIDESLAREIERNL